MDKKDFEGTAYQLVSILEETCNATLSGALPLVRAALMSAAARGMGNDYGFDDDRARIDAAHQNGVEEGRERVAAWLAAWGKNVARAHPVQSQIALRFASSIRSQAEAPEPFEVTQGACEHGRAMFELAADAGALRLKGAGSGYVVVAAVGKVTEDQLRFAIQELVPSCKA